MRRFVVGTLLALVPLTLGCTPQCVCATTPAPNAVGATSGDVLRHPTAPAATGVTPTTGPAITIVNRSPVSICYVHVSSSRDTDWGPDRLGSTETIAPGAVRSWSVEPGEWDVMMRDCQRRPIFEQRRVVVANGATELVFVGPGGIPPGAI